MQYEIQLQLQTDRLWLPTPTVRDIGSTSSAIHSYYDLSVLSVLTASSNAERATTTAYYILYVNYSFVNTYSSFSPHKDSAALPPPSTVQRSILLSLLCPTGFPGYTHQTANPHEPQQYLIATICYS